MTGAAAGAPHRGVLRTALVVTVAAFAFGFALVPIYRIACEQLFGIRLGNTPESALAAGGFAVDSTRTVTVEFDANVRQGLQWDFEPELASIDVHPGQLTEAFFVAKNRAQLPIVGQAVPSVAPSRASKYFDKTECFCFTEQMLAAGESRRMPLRFVVDPDLPDGIQRLTLSYSFYPNEIATARLAVAGTQDAAARTLVTPDLTPES